MAEEPEEAGRLMCLTWNTHKDVLITLFDDLLREGSLVDCTLAAEGQFIKAHKIIISACSPYLKALLSEHKEQHPIVILNETTFADLKSMLEYMYKGCVNLPKHDIHRFLEQAEHLQIRGLVHGLRTKSSPGSSSLKKNSDDDDGGSGDDRPPPRAAKKARSRKKQKGPAPKRGKKAAVEPQAVEPQAVELIGEEDVKVECPSDDGEPDADNNSEGFPHPHSSSETSNQGDSSEPIAGRSDEQEMEMEGYDSNIDNNSDDPQQTENTNDREKESVVIDEEHVKVTALPSNYSWFEEDVFDYGKRGGPTPPKHPPVKAFSLVPFPVKSFCVQLSEDEMSLMRNNAEKKARKIFRCNFCSYTDTSKVKLSDHVMGEHYDTTTQCMKAGTSSATEERPSLIGRPPKSRPPKAVPYRSPLKFTMLVCEVCKSCFHTLYTLNRHLKTYHGTPMIKSSDDHTLFWCTKCGTMFNKFQHTEEECLLQMNT